MTIQSHTSITTISGSVPTVFGPGHSHASTYTVGESHTGGDNARWIEAVKAGSNATNSLQATRSFCEFRPMDIRGTVWYSPTFQVGTQAHGVRGYPNGFQPSMPAANHSSSALADCVARFNGKLQEEMRPVQGLVFLGEIREAIRMVKHAGKLLLTDIGNYALAARAYLRSTYRGRKAVKSLSDLWLQYAFGWTPLFSDVAAGVKILAQPRSERRLIRAWGESRSVFDQLAPNPLTLGTLNALECDTYYRNTNVSSAQQVACVDLTLVGQPSNDAHAEFQNTAERWGLTARQFIPAAWELIPYSFLVDYYVNIGDIIDSAFADRRAIRWGYQTQRTTAINETRWIHGRPKKNTYYCVLTANQPGSIKVGTKRFSRGSSLLAIPPLVLGYPDFGGLKYANQAALILGRLRTR